MGDLGEVGVEGTQSPAGSIGGFGGDAEPAEGYGEHDAAMVQRVPRRQLKGISKIYVGMKLHAQTPEGPREVRRQA